MQEKSCFNVQMNGFYYAGAHMLLNHVTSSYTCSQDRQYGLLFGCISYLSVWEVSIHNISLSLSKKYTSRLWRFKESFSFAQHEHELYSLWGWGGEFCVCMYLAWISMEYMDAGSHIMPLFQQHLLSLFKNIFSLSCFSLVI